MMEPYRLHVYACDQKKPEGAPCCSARGSVRVIEALRREVAAAGLADQVQVTTCGSLGLCTRGPNMVVYPDGVWYSGVRLEDVPEIVREHFAGGRVVQRLANPDRAALRAEVDDNKRKALAARAAADAVGALPDDFLQSVRAYQASRTLLSAVELDAFTAVGSGVRAGEVAAKLGTSPRATEMLLDALVALEVLRKQDGAYAGTPLSARYLVAGAKDDARAALLHQAHLWARWSTLSDCVRRGTSVSFRDTAERGDEWTTAFVAAMHRNAIARAPEVVQAVGVEGARRMLDVGGGSGAYSIAFARASQDLRVEILDLPAVLPLARRHVEEAGLQDRITARPGDLRTDDLGVNYDLILLSAICHMLGPDANVDLLRRCMAALSPGGRVVIQDFILEPDRTAPRSAALFSLNMLVGTREGSCYTGDEYGSWLRRVGFDGVRQVAPPGPTGLVIARRP